MAEKNDSNDEFSLLNNTTHNGRQSNSATATTGCTTFNAISTSDSGTFSATLTTAPATIRFTGPSLASACSSAIKSYLNTVSNHTKLASATQNILDRNNGQFGASMEIGGAEQVRNDHDDEEDNSDICSLPECDSDLLGKFYQFSVFSLQNIHDGDHLWSDDIRCAEKTKQKTKLKYKF